MVDDRPSLILALLKALLRSSLLFAWGGGLIYFAGPPGPTVAQDASNRFSLLLTGMILISFGVVFMIYNVMKKLAPAKRSERPTEAAAVTFDPDAAVERYLAAKQDIKASAEPPVPTLAARPVFGRRNGASSQNQ